MHPDELNPIADSIRDVFTAKNSARDATISGSRELIRFCSECIRAIHRRDWDVAEARLATIREARDALLAGIAGYPDLIYTGYTRDALKEVVEAHATYAARRCPDRMRWKWKRRPTSMGWRKPPPSCAASSSTSCAVLKAIPKKPSAC